jgi:hypothetical protein
MKLQRKILQAMKTTSWKYAVLLMPIAFVLACSPALLHAQGCAQCLDATQATPPAVQAGYRHAIYLLAGAGAALFLATLVLIRRFR